MSLSNHPTRIKARQTMVKKLGSLEAYRLYMKEIAALGGKVRVPKGYAVTKRRSAS